MLKGVRLEVRVLWVFLGRFFVCGVYRLFFSVLRFLEEKVWLEFVCVGLLFFVKVMVVTVG